MLDKLKALIKAKQKQFDENTYDPYVKGIMYGGGVDGWVEGLQWVLNEIDKLEKEEKDRKFSLTNKKNAKKFTIKRKNYDEAKQWLINHLDLSEEWTIKEEK